MKYELAEFIPQYFCPKCGTESETPGRCPKHGLEFVDLKGYGQILVERADYTKKIMGRSLLLVIVFAALYFTFVAWRG